MIIKKGIRNIVLLPLLMLVASCGNMAELENDGNQIGEPLIFLYPYFDIHDKECAFHGCVGKASVIGDQGYSTFDINVGREPLIDLSPSKGELILSTSDGYVIYDEGWFEYKSQNASTFSRYVEIDDQRRVLVISHLGARLDGGGFETGIISGAYPGLIENNHQINGTVVSCDNNIYLFSHGDEGLDSGDLTKLEYIFDFNKNKFKIIDRSKYYEYDAIYSYGCIGDGEGSFRLLLDISGEFNLATYSHSEGFHDVRPVLGLDSYDYLYERNSMILENGTIFLMSQYGKMFKIGADSNVANVIWDLGEAIPGLGETGLGALIHLDEEGIFVLMKREDGEYELQEIDIYSGKIMRSKNIKYIYHIYGSNIPQLMAIINIDRLREYMDSGR